MSKRIKEMFAEVTDYSYRRGKPFSVGSEQKAVAETLKMNGMCFSTYEVESVFVDGKKMSGAPAKYSGVRYVGIDRVYTLAEAIDEMKKDMDICPDGTKWAIQNMQQNHKPTDCFVTGLERSGEFTPLSDGQKVFNRQGEQIWPKKKTREPKAAKK